MNPALILVILVALISVILSVYPQNNLFGPPSIAGSHDKLANSKIVKVDGALGPESLAFDPNGEGPYAGVADGRILKWLGDEKGWTDFAFTSSKR